MDSLRQMCFALPTRATAKLEEPLEIGPTKTGPTKTGPRNSVGNTNGQFSKIQCILDISFDEWPARVMAASTIFFTL